MITMWSLRRIMMMLLPLESAKMRLMRWNLMMLDGFGISMMFQPWERSAWVSGVGERENPGIFHIFSLSVVFKEDNVIGVVSGRCAHNLNSWSFSARTTKMLKSLNIAVIPKSGTPNVNQTFVKFNDQTVKILKINISNSLKMSTCWNFKYQQTCQQKWPPGDEWLASDFASWHNSFFHQASFTKTLLICVFHHFKISNLFQIGFDH